MNKSKHSIFTLVPERVQYPEFWVEIRRRNRWLIYLRYGAVLMLVLLTTGLTLLDNLSLNFRANTIPLWIIAFCILLYNLIFHRMWITMAKTRKWHLKSEAEYGRRRFTSMHFSLLQIVVDFIALLLFIYFSGSVETPLYIFFIFHVIIGSLLLPGAIMLLIVGLTIIITFTGALLECWGYIPHYQISGLLSVPLYNNIYYVLIYFSIVTISLFLSSYLANSIARQLYNRERMLSIAYKELEEAEKTKSRYVMSVVHDLKTPIAAASTYLNILLDGTLGNLQPQQIKPLERCKTRLSNAINIINDILHISQLKLEEKMEKPINVPICKVFSEISQEMQVLFKSKKINYSYTCEKQGELFIKADYNLIRLAFSNLVSNAYKYTEDNGIVEISVDDKQDWVSITVADNGIGIPQAEIDKIFNDFYRSSISKKLDIEGTGLGLSLVKKIVDKYGGSITVQSPSYLKTDEKRPGTQFTLIFPKS